MRKQAGFSWLGPEVMWVHLSRSYVLSKEVCKIFRPTLDGYPENTLISWTMGIASQVGQPSLLRLRRRTWIWMCWRVHCLGLHRPQGFAKQNWLVLGTWLLFFPYIYTYVYIGNVIIPTDELIFFRGVGLNHQPENLLEFLLFVSKKQGSCGI
jgi:hypothetical protein